MATATPILGAVPITQFTAQQQAQLRAGSQVGNYQVLNGHVMDLRTVQGQALLTQHQANAAAAAAAQPAAGTSPPAAPDATPAATGAVPTGGVFSPSPGKGAWMNPSQGGFNQGHTTFPDGSQVPGNQTGSATAPGMSAADAAKDAANKDAFASLKDTLSQYGLDNLADFAWQEIVSGRTPTEVLQDIRETPQFNARFPAIKQRQQAGLPALSPGEYVSYENSATQYMRAAGLPQGFYDGHDDFTKFLANDVSLSELASRIDLAKQAAYQAPPEVRQALRGQYGLGDGDLAAFFLDPDRAEPLLQRTYNAATISGAGARTGFDINSDQAFRLADQGVNANQAQAGFAQLGHDKELFTGLPGQSGEGTITSDQQLAAQFGGNAAQQDLIERRRQQRQAQFQDSEQFASTQQGFTGLGVAGQR